MTKIDGHYASIAAQQIDQCLQRLRTDVIDLIQIHEVIRPDDPERAFATGGSMEALLAARQDGKIRYIGFTGHKDPALHLKMLGMPFEWDTVQMPLNCVDPVHNSFEANVLPVLVQRNIGVLGMKPLAAGAAVREGVASAEECLRYAMSLPTSVVITGCDTLEIVEQAIRIWKNFVPMTSAELAALRARTAASNPDGLLERYKTTIQFDGTVRNPHWLTSASVTA
jgi:predicted aldo/keto reductase-like oxidoreductase